MKRNTFALLLIFPVLLSIATVSTVAILNNYTSVDISDIHWNFKQNMSYKINKEKGYLLEATPVYDNSKELAEGNNLVWKIKGDENVAHISLENSQYFLYALTPGNVEVICSNEKNSVSKSFKATIYDKGVITINTKIASLGSNNIDDTVYFGEYNPSYQTPLVKDGLLKNKAKFTLDIEAKLGDNDTSYNVIDISDNIAFDTSSNEMTFKSSGSAHLTLALSEDSNVQATYKFEIIEDAINVYNYNDLLMGTNFSTKGEKIVLMTNLGSLNETYKSSYDTNGNFVSYLNEPLRDDTKLFGNYDFKSKTFSFKDEYYTFETTSNTNYLKQYNAFAKEHDQKVDSGLLTGETAVKAGLQSSTLIAGIRLQKDLYGNGYTINESNLAFPNNGSVGKDGKLKPNKEKDYFLGGVPFFTLGYDSEPFMQIFSQDNVGLYLDGDNILVNDLKMKNVDTQNNMFNYYYGGTVVEVNGKNNTIKNSILSNGRRIVRAFDGDGLMIENSILQNASMYLLSLGSNKYIRPDYTKKVQKTFKIDGETLTFDGNAQDFLERLNIDSEENSTSATADYAISNLFTGTVRNATDAENIFTSVQDALDETKGIINSDGSINYDSNITVNNVKFYNSAFFSIGFESCYNGIYLENGAPSIVKMFLGDFIFSPTRVSGTSYPVKLTLEGDTKFYNYTDISKLDLTNFLEQQLDKLLSFLGGSSNLFGLDDVFPFRKVFKEAASKDNYIYKVSDESGNETNYLNTVALFHGGGLNYSTLVDHSNSSDDLGKETDIDLIKEYVADQADNGGTSKLSICKRATAIVMGSHPFRFISNKSLNSGEKPPLFGETPNIDELKRN